MSDTDMPLKSSANPAPLGLMGFGMTTVLLNLHNADIIAADSLGMIFAMGIFYGGLAQIKDPYASAVHPPGEWHLSFMPRASALVR